MIDLSHAHLGDFGKPDQRSGAALDYGPPGGAEPLRAAAADWYGVPPDRLAVTTGASLGLTAALASLQGGVRLLCPRPCYPHYPRLAALLGLDIAYFDLIPERGWQARPEDILSLAAAGPAVLLVNWPSNPTGALPSDDVLEAIADARRRHGSEIISDETYGDFVYGGRPPFDLAGLIGPASVVSIKSGSKLLNCPGERLGFAIAEPERLIRLCHAHWTIALSPPAFAQAVGLARFRGDLHQELASLRQALEAQRDLLVALLEASHLFSLVPPAGGTFLWVKSNAADGDAQALLARSAKRGLKVASGQGFGDASANWFRISFAADSGALRRAAGILIQSAEDLIGNDRRHG
ncbi:pyridoxal phosphate-dependent aminotransferase [Sphingomonas psychrotolerans]|uniref:aspartate transaminase n=1 Tax=Sphingomonas psychrotolerans TaxID=1327635 RepID=A0ABU3N102_9SPHN|nr:pyridoxal phosphate-dependent aminotransferase [Sphingomonas psychrotolerans]MDT8757201.1 pyridoxal phosphate-dependent aminotransferase [Sphingomonas psychrotolerans]